MDAKLVFCVLLFSSAATPVNAQPWNTYIPCTKSADCPTFLCCRDAGGNLSGGEGGGLPPWVEDDGIVVGGTCWYGPSRPGTVCSQQCGCGAGYTCYKTLTGVCCPPTTCWNATEAAKDKEFWENCHNDPNCAFPPVANPGR
ncbi:uncharacterized protein LOC127845371 [Dreissena polymorpha]|uniref:Uncharacterized protein n=1 Tax=Dreissena polymorpha TaxID=45954 RepID=A0A9D4ECY2_DREPO|nr:uncharacterized protein LOC127845371 [Dreissena polymorpha]KAH3776411.1 hypothetical protein DPMN_177834 [Dreissena polymorpha]